MTVMTEESFSELVQFINTHPTWRRRLQKALFPDIDIAQSFKLLVETQKQMQQTLQQLTKRTEHIEQDVTVLKQDVTVLKQDVTVLKQDVTVLKQDMKQVKGNVADLKGYNYESRIIQYAASVFGQCMRKGQDIRNHIGNLLEKAEDDGLITEQEHDQVLALDLLWGGKQKKIKTDIVLAVEVSWRAEETDITRSVTRSNILRKIGLTALPVVAGSVWDEATATLAREQKVVLVIDRTVDSLSWQNAF